MTDSLIFGKLLGVPASTLNNPAQDIYNGNIDETRYYQEFRLSSLEESETKWTAGVNFFRSDADLATNGSNFSLPNFFVFSGQQNNKLTVNSYAAFADGSVPIAGGLRALGGIASRISMPMRTTVTLAAEYRERWQRSNAILPSPTPF